MREQVFWDPKAHQLVQQAIDVIEQALLQQESDKEQEKDVIVHVAVGSDRGKHRSVSIAMEIGRQLQARRIQDTVVHRDIDR